jgi:hypothetical protein
MRGIIRGFVAAASLKRSTPRRAVDRTETIIRGFIAVASLKRAPIRGSDHRPGGGTTGSPPELPGPTRSSGPPEGRSLAGRAVNQKRGRALLRQAAPFIAAASLKHVAAVATRPSRERMIRGITRARGSRLKCIYARLQHATALAPQMRSAHLNASE